MSRDDGLHSYSDDDYIEGVDDPYTIAASIEAGHYLDEERVFPDNFDECGLEEYGLDAFMSLIPPETTRYLKILSYGDGIQLIDGGLDDADVFEAIKQIIEHHGLDVESVCEYINPSLQLE